MKKLSFMLIAFSLIAISSCSDNQRHYYIGVSQCSDDSWRMKFNEEMTLSTFLYDNVELTMKSANDDDQLQMRQIDSLVDEGVDLLVVSPNQLHTVSRAINRANERGIPVILFDRKSDTRNYRAYIGADNVEIGREMARYLAIRLGGKGRIVEVQGLKGSSAAIERHRGFVEILSGYPGIEIVDSCYGGWTAEEAKEGMKRIVDGTRNIDAVFAHNDRMAMGAREVAEANGLHNIIYIGIDALPIDGGGLQLVEESKLDASYIYPTRGDLVVQLALNILENKPFERENAMRGALVTKDNAHALLLQNEEMTKQRSRLYNLHSKVDQYFVQYSHQRVYAILSSIIIVLLIVSFTILYRWIVAKRRMAEQAAEEKLVFFTNVSHEFRTPLTLIADPIDRILNDRSLDDDQRLSLVRLARRNVSVVLQMVNQILDFRKYQKGKMTLRLSRFDIANEVSLLLESFKSACDHKGVDLRLVANGELQVIADRKKIDRIVYNLLSNALKFTPKGGHIEVAISETDGDINISVKDNGCGMSKDDASHVFERFYQARNTQGGTGIGLALVKIFVEMHQGNILVDSEVGKGSTFSVTMPCEQQGELSPDENEQTDIAKPAMVADGDTHEMTAKEKATNVELGDNDKPTLLIVDDNEDVRSYIANIMAASCRVIQAADGQTAIERAVKEVPDIIVSDVMMPGIDGLDLCRRLKQERATSHIPIVILTARTQDNQRAEGYDCGADAYITKPFSSQVLQSRVKNLLDNRRQLKSLFGLNETVDIKAGDADAQFIADFNRCVVRRMGDSSFNVDVLCSELGLSRAQTYRKIKALTGSSPVELIRSTRLKRADQLLRSGNHTISEVCYEVGFTSPSYFAKCFKEEFGRLPSE